MNESQNTDRMPDTRLLDDRIFDRLVDGDLSPDEYHQVLQALPHHPRGWQRCAEAFLEAQAWRQELGQVRRSPAAPEAEKLIPVPKSAAKSVAADWLKMLVVAAASFLFAFVAAQWYWRLSTPIRTDYPGGAIAIDTATNRPDVDVAQHSAQGSLEEVDSTAEALRHVPLTSVQLSVNRPGQADPQVMNVPVYDPAAASELLSNSEPALPEDLLNSLAAEGHAVDLQRKLVPVSLGDGRQMMLPVEGYRIMPVSRPSY
jgi:hypothetical protein